MNCVRYFVVVEPGGRKRSVPIIDPLFFGREYAGINEGRRMVIPDPEMSRSRLEFRVDDATDQAIVIDTALPPIARTDAVEAAGNTRPTMARVARLT